MTTRRHFLSTSLTLLASSIVDAQSSPQPKLPVYLVPNFHPASCGWLTTFSKERVYCANSYLNHLDRVRDDPSYKFVLSEVNNIVAIMNFRPERIPELKDRVREKRVEFVNGYFLESTINLSGGEALVRLGVEGLRWYQQMFGVQPRFSWNIDVCGTHEQMPQIAVSLASKRWSTRERILPAKQFSGRYRLTDRKSSRSVLATTAKPARYSTRKRR